MKRILYLHSSLSVIPLAEACFSLTPKVSVYKTNELILEISETQKFFGGDAGVLLKLEELVSFFKMDRTVVLTDRPEWARAFRMESDVILPPGESAKSLLALPIDQLQYCGDPLAIEEERVALIAFMKRVGMRCISDFAKLPPIAINRRFGKMGLTLLEWVRGERELLIPIFVPGDPIRETLETGEITSLETLLFYLRQTLIRIEARLCGRAVMAQELVLTFFLESRKKLVRHLKLSEPQKTAQGLLALLREFLSGLQWDSPLQSLGIEVSDTVPYVPSQLLLFENAESRFHDLAQFVAKLKARYGNQSVGSPQIQESYYPESSWKNTWPPVAPKNTDALFPERPLLLYTPPKPYRSPSLSRLTSSESLYCEWWEGGGERQYFIAENPQGEKLWVFRDSTSGQWFLHGVFD